MFLTATKKYFTSKIIYNRYWKTLQTVLCGICNFWLWLFYEFLLASTNTLQFFSGIDGLTEILLSRKNLVWNLFYQSNIACLVGSNFLKY